MDPIQGPGCDEPGAYPGPEAGCAIVGLVLAEGRDEGLAAPTRTLRDTPAGGAPLEVLGNAVEHLQVEVSADEERDPLANLAAGRVEVVRLGCHFGRWALRDT